MSSLSLLKKIDSNSSGLRYCVESAISVLPAADEQVWKLLQPNSYPDFGAKTKTAPRMPINPSRQILKGTLVDLDPDGGFQNDLTQDGLTDLMQGFFFASLEESFDTTPYNATVLNPNAGTIVVANSGHKFELTYGGADFANLVAGDLLFTSGFTNASNNGLFNVSSLTETLATGTFTETSTNNFTNGDTITIGTRVYTFQTALTDVDGNVLIGANFADSAANLVAAINDAGADSPGVNYYVTQADPNVTAAFSTTINLTAIYYGTGPDAVATVYTAAGTSAGSFGAGTLAGGAASIVTTQTGVVNETAPAGARIQYVGVQGGAGDLTIVQPGANTGLPSMQSTSLNFTTLPLTPGQWIWIGGDGALDAFDMTVNNGWARIRSIAAHVLTFDKTSSEMVNDTAADQTVQFFWGKFLQNQPLPQNQIRRTYTLERTLGNPDQNNPTAPQAEYLVGSVPNEVSFNMTTAEKITLDLTFLSTDYQTIDTTGTILSEVEGASTPSLANEDAYNTTSDISRARMTVVSSTDSGTWTDASPTPMFAEVTELKFMIKNNLKPNKALGKLGPFEITAGFFEGSGSVQAYFSDVDAVQAVRENQDVSLDVAMVRNNHGIVIDLPLLTLTTKGLDVKINEPIMLPIDITIGSDRVYNFTASMQFFAYLPTLATPIYT